MSHPIRNAEIHAFNRAQTFDSDAAHGVEWIAMFYPYKTYPVYFSGRTKAAVIEQAEAMRTDAIEKYEADCIRRAEMSRKAKERKAAKEAAAQ